MLQAKEESEDGQGSLEEASPTEVLEMEGQTSVWRKQEGTPSVLQVTHHSRLFSCFLNNLYQAPTTCPVLRAVEMWK